MQKDIVLESKGNINIQWQANHAGLPLGSLATATSPDLHFALAQSGHDPLHSQESMPLSAGQQNFSVRQLAGFLGDQVGFSGRCPTLTATTRCATAGRGGNFRLFALVTCASAFTVTLLSARK